MKGGNRRRSPPPSSSTRRRKSTFYKSPVALLPLRNEEKADEENISHGNEIMEKEMSFGAASRAERLDGICWFVLHTGQE